MLIPKPGPGGNAKTDYRIFYFRNRLLKNHRSMQYPQVCFNYIHNNTVKAGLVDKSVDWEFSSAMDYFVKRKGTLVNESVTKEYISLKEIASSE